MDLVQIQIKRAVLQQTLRAMTSHVMSPYKLLIAGNIDANFFLTTLFCLLLLYLFTVHVPSRKQQTEVAPGFGESSTSSCNKCTFMLFYRD